MKKRTITQEEWDYLSGKTIISDYEGNKYKISNLHNENFYKGKNEFLEEDNFVEKLIQEGVNVIHVEDFKE